MTTAPIKEAEHELISTALEVEQIDVNLYRSKSLWMPAYARGVFGGQVISQALVSATNSVDPAFGLHSLHCYFLTSASPATPVLYTVERVRQGRSYVTRVVKASQKGHIVFVMMCSFQKPEPWQPQYQWTMPEVPPPEQCVLEEERYRQRANDPGLNAKARAYLSDLAVEREHSPIAIKIAKERIMREDGSSQYAYWFQARNIPDYETAYQKCILGYLSDLRLIGTVAQTLGLKGYAMATGAQALGMSSTIDHSIYYYSDSLDCGDWLLYVMTASRAASGRGVAHGQLYTRDGTLVAITAQEGVVRADVRGPNAKL
ncbi:Thioesterase/thiol ester dehydrase-isomerase [Schizophyllum commune H4-8]|uniref:Thioesterase/thiol ester dehydrase-isomerase n=1 Tax=Schizophyllum commune (strain H4-8 / FGSC 9210) TaxID=578458 RepID=UPI00215F0FCF|nr:Thioesterase/thiol ester dehydrase-isomerase [Schizophyllum commune H4-8]KAI5898592.1 Thioesterase/thiol ester dehydrase-isomerase [Schizophyllum commune H4-8]